MEQRTGVIRTTNDLYLYSENSSYQIIRKIKPKSLSLFFCLDFIPTRNISFVHNISCISIPLKYKEATDSGIN